MCAAQKEGRFDFLATANAARKILVMGTLSDYSGSRNRRYRAIARKAAQVADHVFFVGFPAYPALRNRGAALRSVSAFPSLRELDSKLRTVLRAGDLVVVKGSQRSDHLVRLLLNHHRPIKCWRMDCGLKTYCSSCTFLREEM